MPPKKLPLRPYVGNTSRLEFHKDNNAVENADVFLDFLLKAGKKRLTATQKLTEPDKSVDEFKEKFITIGLKQTIKAFQSCKIAWFLIDEKLTHISAVGNVVGLMATNLAKKGKLYIVPGILSTLAKELQLPRISAIGFGFDCTELAAAFDGLKPIELVSRTAKAVFQVPPLSVPVGKPVSKINAKKQRKQQKKQERKDRKEKRRF